MDVSCYVYSLSSGRLQPVLMKDVVEGITGELAILCVSVVLEQTCADGAVLNVVQHQNNCTAGTTTNNNSCCYISLSSTFGSLKYP